MAPRSPHHYALTDPCAGIADPGTPTPEPTPSDDAADAPATTGGDRSTSHREDHEEQPPRGTDAGVRAGRNSPLHATSTTHL